MSAADQVECAAAERQHGTVGELACIHRGIIEPQRARIHRSRASVADCTAEGLCARAHFCDAAGARDSTAERARSVIEPDAKCGATKRKCACAAQALELVRRVLVTCENRRHLQRRIIQHHVRIRELRAGDAATARENERSVCHVQAASVSAVVIAEDGREIVVRRHAIGQRVIDGECLRARGAQTAVEKQPADSAGGTCTIVAKIQRRSAGSRAQLSVPHQPASRARAIERPREGDCRSRLVVLKVCSSSVDLKRRTRRDRSGRCVVQRLLQFVGSLAHRGRAGVAHIISADRLPSSTRFHDVHQVYPSAAIPVPHVAVERKIRAVVDRQRPSRRGSPTIDALVLDNSAAGRVLDARERLRCSLKVEARPVARSVHKSDHDARIELIVCEHPQVRLVGIHRAHRHRSDDRLRASRFAEDESARVDRGRARVSIRSRSTEGELAAACLQEVEARAADHAIHPQRAAVYVNAAVRSHCHGTAPSIVARPVCERTAISTHACSGNRHRLIREVHIDDTVSFNLQSRAARHHRAIRRPAESPRIPRNNEARGSRGHACISVVPVEINSRNSRRRKRQPVRARDAGADYPENRVACDRRRCTAQRQNVARDCVAAIKCQTIRHNSRAGNRHDSRSSGKHRIVPICPRSIQKVGNTIVPIVATGSPGPRARSDDVINRRSQRPTIPSETCSVARGGEGEKRGDAMTENVAGFHNATDDCVCVSYLRLCFVTSRPFHSMGHLQADSPSDAWIEVRPNPAWLAFAEAPRRTWR